MQVSIPTLEASAGEPLYQTLAAALRQMAQQLPAHSQLPSIRQIAQETDVSSSTVVAALDLLAAEGIIYKRRGSGSYVSPATDTVIDEFVPRELPADRIDFTLGTPSPEYFPVDDFKAAFNYVLDRDRGHAFSYPEPMGYLPLRLSLAAYLQQQQGVPVSPAAIQITSGAQQAISLITQTLIAPGDLVCIENPSYPGAIQAMQQAGARLLPITMSPQGPRQQDLINAGKLKPKLFYTIPNFQNPTGICYGRKARDTLLQLAQEHDFYILEDDHVSELYYGISQPRTLWQEAPERVLYVKSFSKLFMPGLRLGFMVLPSPILAAVSQVKQTADLGSSGINQRLLDAYLRSGKWKEYQDFLRQTYQHRAQVLYSALQRNLGNAATYYPLRGGMNAWLTFPQALDTARLQAMCAQAGVIIALGNDFSVTGHEFSHCIRLSLAATFPDKIEAGVQVLAACAEKLL